MASSDHSSPSSLPKSNRFRQAISWLLRALMLLIALVVGYASRSWTRPPIWELKLSANDYVVSTSPDGKQVACIEKFDPERPKDRLGVVTVNALTGRIENSASILLQASPLKTEFTDVQTRSWNRLVVKDQVRFDAKTVARVTVYDLLGKKMLQLDDVDSHQMWATQSALIYVSPMSLLKPGDEQCVHHIPFDKSKPARVIARYSYVPNEIPSVQLLDDQRHVAMLRISKLYQANPLTVDVVNSESGKTVASFNGEFANSTLPPGASPNLVGAFHWTNDAHLRVSRTYHGREPPPTSNTAVESINLQWKNNTLTSVALNNERIYTTKFSSVREHLFVDRYWVREQRLKVPGIQSLCEVASKIGATSSFENTLGWLNDPNRYSLSIVDDRDQSVCCRWNGSDDQSQVHVSPATRIAILQPTGNFLKAYSLTPLMPTWLFQCGVTSAAMLLIMFLRFTWTRLLRGPRAVIR